MRIGIDLDGCVYDYVSAIWNARCRLSGDVGVDEPMSMPEVTQWEIWECWDMTQGEWEALVLAADGEGVFHRGCAYPGSIEALAELQSLGHTLHIVTARLSAESQHSTINWLNSVGVPHDTLTFSNNKLDVPVDVFIEDSVDNAVALHKAGRTVFLMARPWNRGFEGDIPVVITWEDFVAEVQHCNGQTCTDEEIIRQFSTGASRDVDTDKLDYEGFLSPLVLRRYAEYMHTNRHMADGSLRASDNWQKGMPFDVYMKSMWRHFQDVWTLHRGFEAGEVAIDEALTAMFFNVQGYLHEVLVQDQGGKS